MSRHLQTVTDDADAMTVDADAMTVDADAMTVDDDDSFPQSPCICPAFFRVLDEIQRHGRRLRCHGVTPKRFGTISAPRFLKLRRSHIYKILIVIQ
jgi:hypothetical protein